MYEIKGRVYGAAREIKGEIGMGINGWYMAGEDSAGRNMTAGKYSREAFARNAGAMAPGAPRRVVAREAAARDVAAREAIAREMALRDAALREPRARRRAPAKPSSSYTEFNAVDNNRQVSVRPGNQVAVQTLAAQDAEIIKAERPARKAKAAKAVKSEKAAAKAAKAPAKSTSRKKKKSAAGAVIGVFGALIVVAAAATGGWYYLAEKQGKDNLKKEVVIEAGSSIKIEDFFSNCPVDAKFVTDVSDIDTDVPAVYQLTISYEKAFTEDVTLKIEDHTGPDGKAISQRVYTTWKMPEAEECVDGLYDLSGIAVVKYGEGTPKFEKGGEFSVPVTVTDMYGNDTVIKVPFTVIDDREAPVIEGVRDIEIEGDASEIDLLEGIFAYDDFDPEPTVKVNDFSVNYKKSGEYEVTYSAIDEAGNVSNVSAKLKIVLPESEKDKNKDVDKDSSDSDSSSSSGSSGSSGSSSSGSSDSAYSAAENVMSSLWRDSDVETARAIFKWVHSNISYQTVSDYMTYEEAAYRGFTRRSGDCYVYFACAKMLLDCAGIPNMMVERFPVYSNGHYWNLVQLDGEWYHCDATVFRDHPAMYFMCTDDEIDDSHHSFNGALYPERAGGSSEYYVAPTPEPTETPEPTATPAPTEEPTPTPSEEPTETTEPTETSEPSYDPVATDDPYTGQADTDYTNPPVIQPGEEIDLAQDPNGVNLEA